jgi:hypothetical protein
MALRARLSAPQPEPKEWPYHEAQWTALPVRVLTEGQRRLEAENYLSSGYGVRLAIEARPKGWTRFSHPALVSQPPRTKATLVSSEYGRPFLAATQVFDMRPIPRKWLAVEKIAHANDLLVERGTILVTRSGAVGRATLAFSPHLSALISDDLLRVKPRDEKSWGWLYAYLRAPKSRAMMTSSRYGHIIKHLETSHLNSLPIPTLGNSMLKDFSRRAHEVLEFREKAYAVALEAETHFERCIGPLRISDFGESGFVVRASRFLFGQRRRLDGLPHNPGVQAVWKHLGKHGKGFTRIGDAAFRVWLPTRFRRIPAADGVDFLDSADLFEINPDIEKRIADIDFGDEHRGRVQPGWLLMARSGQIYGINGTFVLATQALANKVISDHIVRIAPSEKPQIRTGYMVTALSHPILGRPLVKSMAYGSSIPELEPEDVAQFQLVRLRKRDEDHIAGLAEKSAELRGKADILENQLAADADLILGRFIAGESFGLRAD